MDNVVLIGMPGCGKSTVGVLLAKALGLDFVDTDVVIQAQNGDRLQTLVDTCGVDAFLKLEEDTVAALDVHRTVIATGGSVIYGARAMERLHRDGVVVYIKLEYPAIKARIHNLESRGITLREGQTLYDLYQERVPLYEAGCDICFEPVDGDIEKTVETLAAMIRAWEKETQPVEKWDLYDRSGVKTGKVMTRGEAVPAGFYHTVVHIWVMNEKGEYLIQRRAQGVSWKPGLWAVTGGSALAGEGPFEAALRELREEIGLRVEPARMRLLSRLRRSNSFCYIYRALANVPADAFVLQPEEVERVQWVSREEIEQMRVQGTFYDYGDMYFRMIWERMDL